MILSQIYEFCRIDIDQIIPIELQNQKPYTYYEELNGKQPIYLNNEWIEQLRSSGEHCYMKSIRAAKRKDIKKNADIQYALFINSKNVFGMLDENTAFYKDSIYSFEKRLTEFKWWVGMNIQNYQGEDLFTKAQGSWNCGSLALDFRFQSIDMEKLKGARVQLYSKSTGSLYFLVGDTLIVGGRAPFQNDTPIAVDYSLIQLLENFRLDSSLVGKSIVINNFDMHDYKISSYPKYSIIDVKFKRTKRYEYSPMLIVNQQNKAVGKLLEIDLSDPRLTIYDEVSFTQAWNENRDKFLEYLSSTFSEREVESILDRRIFLGMTEHALYESIGKPYETNSTIVNGLTHIQCVYGDGVFIYLENGKVSAFQNIESLSR